MEVPVADPPIHAEKIAPAEQPQAASKQPEKKSPSAWENTKNGAAAILRRVGLAGFVYGLMLNPHYTDEERNMNNTAKVATASQQKENELDSNVAAAVSARPGFIEPPPQVQQGGQVVGVDIDPARLQQVQKASQEKFNPPDPKVVV